MEIKMADVDKLKEDLAKLMTDMESLKAEASKAKKLEEELAKTKALVESYKTSSKTVYLNKDRKLHKFSGRPEKDTEPTAEEWIEYATHHMKCIEGNDAKIEYLRDHLIGKAKDEIRIRSEYETDTPEKILNIIKSLM